MRTKTKIRKKDLRILSELDKNARQSNQKIGKRVGTSKEVVKYRIDKMIESGIIVKFHTVINYFKLGIRKFKLYLRLKNIDKKTLDRIARYFKKHKKTEWVATATGKWDLIVGFFVKNANEFDDEVQKTLHLYSKFIAEKSITTTLHLAHHEREFLQKNKKSKSKIIYHTLKDNQEKINKTDLDILKILTNNARMPITKIANTLKKTPRVIQYRIKALEKKKIILAYKAHINPKKTDKIFCKAIIYLTNLTKLRLDEFTDYASSIKGAVWPQRVLGNWDFELDMELESYDEFQEILRELNEKFSDIIKNHEFCIVSEEYKLDLFPQ